MPFVEQIETAIGEDHAFFLQAPGLHAPAQFVAIYDHAFWRDAGLQEIILPCALLALMGLSTLVAAQVLAVKRARL